MLARAPMLSSYPLALFVNLWGSSPYRGLARRVAILSPQTQAWLDTVGTHHVSEHILESAGWGDMQQVPTQGVSMGRRHVATWWYMGGGGQCEGDGWCGIAVHMRVPLEPVLVEPTPHVHKMNIHTCVLSDLTAVWQATSRGLLSNAAQWYSAPEAVQGAGEQVPPCTHSVLRLKA